MPPIGQSEVILARQWLAELCAVETTSGQEDALLPTVQRFLAEIAPAALPVTTLLQPVAPGRTNVLALWGQPRVLLTTHLDTVPPFVPPRWDGRRCLGRGTCDAKGQIVAQWLAIRRLVTDGPGNVAWLGVVGEETDSLGAATAAADPEWRSRFEVCRAVINGEPTELKLATGQRGLERFILTCQGQAAHSGLPELGRSALWMLFDWLHDLRQEAAAVDPVLGPEIWNLGRCRGGEAANTIPAQAEAEVLFRTVPGSRLPDRLQALAPAGATITPILREPPQTFTTLPGFAAAPMPFGSDAPHFRRLAPEAALLQVGPGSIRVAHTPEEFIDLDDLLAGAALLERLARSFLAGAAPNAVVQGGRS